MYLPIHHMLPVFRISLDPYYLHAPLLLQDQRTWRNRRSQKLDKMALLDLQSNLQSEIQAKEYIRKELSYSKAKQVEMEK